MKVHETKRIQKDESVRIELTFSKEEMEILHEAQALQSNQSGGSLKATILELAKKYLKTSPSKSSQQMREMNQTCDNRQSSQKNTKIDATSCATVAVNSRYIPREIKRNIFTRDQHCQFKDSNTNKICGSKYFLEIDHVVPRHKNGGHEFENLRLLCANHNKYRYQKSLP